MNCLRSLILSAGLGVSTFFCALPAFAWDGVTAGKIAQIDVTGGSNYGFRVTLVGMPPLCTGGASWAFLNETDSNYKVYVATLLAAKSADRQLTLYTTNAAGGYCQIGYITVS